METQIIPYLGKRDTSKNQSTNVWQFLAKNEKGATFELPSNAVKYDEEKRYQNKYITLNQVNVNVAGSKDKLLVIRDVTHIIYLE